MIPRLAIAFVSGLLFGIGLVLSGMSDPAKVRGFLDVTGAWNPALAFVLAGAVVTAFIGFRLLCRRGAPWCGERFGFPETTRIDAKLLSGSLLFGIGWGLVGLCPGPAVVDLSTGSPIIGLFVVAMLAGMALEAAFVGRGSS